MKCIAIILTTLFFVLVTKAFPLPTFNGDVNFPDDFQLKSLEQIAQEFGFALDGNGTLINPPVGKRDVILNGLEERDHISTLVKRENWEYSCFKGPGPHPQIYWISAYIYVNDRLKKIGRNCKVSQGQLCTNCGCLGGAAVRLCRGGLSPASFQVSNAEVGYRGSLVVREFLMNMLGWNRCGGPFPGCTDRYNCKYEGLATNGGLSEGWYVMLDQERDPGRCIPP
ncbi:hypothetical protein TWF281_002070 [Arthrobotrys megalospora]